MNSIRLPRNRVTSRQYPKFFSMLRNAARNLGLQTQQEIDDYRHRVMMEEAGCESIKQLTRCGGFDACIRRFAVDADDCLAAAEISMMDVKRKAYVIKVMSIQIMQLSGRPEGEARLYLEGILRQARIPCGVVTSDDSFYMDVAPASVQHLVQILDTYRRKLLKTNFPTSQLKFDDTVRYEVDGMFCTRYNSIPPSYYSGIPFRVNVGGAV